MFNQRYKNKTIIVAADIHDDSSFKLISEACDMADQWDADLHLAYSIDMPAAFTDPTVYAYWPQLQGALKELPYSEFEHDKSFIIDTFPFEANHIHIMTGDVALRVAELAKSIDASLIVTGKSHHKFHITHNHAKQILQAVDTDILFLK
ncbi:universal stress protein [Photobacterium profundum]|uniref:universal stress protein n=1 Tax=Photobacterium profundum TaxID=74109 RepID=UPI003D134DB6